IRCRNVTGVQTCALPIFLLLLSISSTLLEISLFDSNYIVFYEIGVFGLIIGFMSRLLLRFNTLSSVTKVVRKIGFYGNLGIVILFFPPIYHFWGTFFGP